jgi:SAM-dependent methyltransferase
MGKGMTNEVIRHYESLLAANYTWMTGVPFDEKVAEQKELLNRLLGGSGFSGLAIDLGSGPGFQSIALADLGYAPVLAVDTSKTLLDELEQHRGGRDIRAASTDLLAFRAHLNGARAGAVVCMGDTLTHLPDRASVTQLFKDVHAALEPGGRFVLTFRELSAPLEGLDRFIPVRSDAGRIMTCFLEYSPETVTVHDLIHTREADGWKLNKSSYKKLRLSAAEVSSALSAVGFESVTSEPAGRMAAVVARR